MVKKEFKIVFSFLFIIIVIAFIGCANQLPPGGGEIDTTPPIVVETYPLNGATNFMDDYIELSFSEYIDKRSLSDALFISPSFDGVPEFDWSGTSVRIYFPEKLNDSITYVFNVGTDVIDYNNKNRMDSAFVLTFSTGDKIDKGKIEGKIYSDKPDGNMIFGYKVKSDLDTLLIRKPDYISQSGKDGFYSLSGLSKGVYRVYAVADEFKDLIFQPEQDKIGMPFKDIVLSDEDTLVSNFNFLLSEYDTIPPRIFSATFTDRHHIIVKFSEPIDSSLIIASNFKVVDSTSHLIITPLYAFKGNTKIDEITLATKDTLSITSSAFLLIDTLKDKNGNLFFQDFTALTISDKPDTNKLSVFKAIPDKNYNKVDFTTHDFFLFFDDAFDKSQASDAISFVDTSGNKFQLELNFIDDATLRISLQKNLLPKNKYFLKIDLSQFIDVEGNKTDTVITYSYSTITGLDFTGVSGKLIGVDVSLNPILVLQEDNKSLIYYTNPDELMNFNFQRIEPGHYSLWCFLDEDGSGNYSFGLPDPIKHAERFSYYFDKLTLKARWSLTDINFIFK
ncbi:MAG: Ig-like domain-containing protein [Ignavibacteriales bacterium]|nr:Ig-like domain-containing protein [Ignavibacteriales bacterium]